jgi:hypothetical protein
MPDMGGSGTVASMALRSCPECDKNVSEFARACPNCGFPLEELGFDRLSPLDSEPKSLTGTNTSTVGDQARPKRKGRPTNLEYELDKLEYAYGMGGMDKEGFLDSKQRLTDAIEVEKNTQQNLTRSAAGEEGPYTSERKPVIGTLKTLAGLGIVLFATIWVVGFLALTLYDSWFDLILRLAVAAVVIFFGIKLMLLGLNNLGTVQKGAVADRWNEWVDTFR